MVTMAPVVSLCSTRTKEASQAPDKHTYPQADELSPRGVPYGRQLSCLDLKFRVPH